MGGTFSRWWDGEAWTTRVSDAAPSEPLASVSVESEDAAQHESSFAPQEPTPVVETPAEPTPVVDESADPTTIEPTTLEPPVPDPAAELWARFEQAASDETTPARDEPVEAPQFPAEAPSFADRVDNAPPVGYATPLGSARVEHPTPDAPEEPQDEPDAEWQGAPEPVSAPRFDQSDAPEQSVASVGETPDFANPVELTPVTWTPSVEPAPFAPTVDAPETREPTFDEPQPVEEPPSNAEEPPAAASVPLTRRQLREQLGGPLTTGPSDRLRRG
jgi:hypothetical protein